MEIIKNQRVRDRICTDCCGADASWHTHPDPDPNYNGRANNFSGTRSDSRVENNPHWYGKIGDIGVARRDGLDIYLVNPRNEVYRYDVKNDVILKIGDIPF